MARPVYRVGGYTSDLGRLFLERLGDQGLQEWTPWFTKHLPAFESSCILYNSIEQAMGAFPYPLEELDQYEWLKEWFEKLHKYNRTLVSAETGEALIEKCGGDKNLSAIQTLIQTMIEGSKVTGSGDRLIVNLAKD